MSSESADRELVSRLVDGLLLCIPLLVLFVSSLGLIALKRISRLPRWAARLAAPPFYFVSLPIATVIAGLEISTWVVVGLYLVFGPYFVGGSGWEAVTLVWFFFRLLPVEMLLAGISFAWMFVSAYLLWRTLREEDGQGSPLKNREQRRRALLLLVAFIWAWGSIGYFVYEAGRH